MRLFLSLVFIFHFRNEKDAVGSRCWTGKREEAWLTKVSRNGLGIFFVYEASFIGGNIQFLWLWQGFCKFLYPFWQKFLFFWWWYFSYTPFLFFSFFNIKPSPMKMFDFIEMRNLIYNWMPQIMWNCRTYLL